MVIRARISALETEGAGGERPKVAKRGHLRSDGIWPWIFLGPIFIHFAIFFAWPLARTVYYSFTEWGLLGDTTWVGAANYINLVSTPDFGRAALNTVIFTAVVAASIPVSLVLAVLINTRGLSFRRFYQAIYFLPVITMPVAVGIVWRLLYAGDFGLINQGLDVVGIDGPYWLRTRFLSLVAVGIVGVWTTLGYNLIIFGAALQGLPRELYEAAELDGAGPFRRFRSLTLPLISPVIFFVSVLTVIAGVQVFDLIFVMLGGTTTTSSIQENGTLMYFFYYEAMVKGDKGFAAAAGIAIVAAIAILTAVQFQLQRRWVHYD